MPELSAADRAKRAAAGRALRFVEDGMRLGLGTGSTATWFVDLLADRIEAEGLSVTAVPTSSRTAAQARARGIPLLTLDDVERLDLTVDGADEADGQKRLIKGGGGALLQEKLVAAASERMVVIADQSKAVKHLGAFPLPVEIVRFGHAHTIRRIEAVLSCEDVGGTRVEPRAGEDALYVTDEGHHIVDLHLRRIGEPEHLDQILNTLPGVVETGLFIGLCDTLVIGAEDGDTRVID